MLSQLLNVAEQLGGFGETLRICAEKANPACLWSVSSREENNSTWEGQLILFFFFILIIICLEWKTYLDKQFKLFVCIFIYIHIFMHTHMYVCLYVCIIPKA